MSVCAELNSSSWAEFLTTKNMRCIIFRLFMVYREGIYVLITYTIIVQSNQEYITTQ